MSRPITFEALQSMGSNARHRLRYLELEGARDFLRLVLAAAYVQLVRGVGREVSESSPIQLLGIDETVMQWRPESKPLEDVHSDVIEILESAFVALNEVDDRLADYLNHQEGLHRLQLRQQSGKR